MNILKAVEVSVSMIHDSINQECAPSQIEVDIYYCIGRMDGLVSTRNISSEEALIAASFYDLMYEYLESLSWNRRVELARKDFEQFFDGEYSFTRISNSKYFEKETQCAFTGWLAAKGLLND